MSREAIYDEVDAEIERARAKYPASDADNRFMGLSQEAGEALQAVVKWRQDPNTTTKAAARLELIQSIGQHVRALEELGLIDPCAVCGDLGMIEDVFFHPDFGPGSAWRPCPVCAKVEEIHWAWKLFYALVGAFVIYILVSNWGM